MTSDIHFWFDPVCPFAWMTSKWVRQVVARRDYTVEWKLISLRLVNRDVDYDAHFPAEYEHGHTAGLRMLRVADAVREAHGAAALDPLYAAMGAHVWERPLGEDADAYRRTLGTAPLMRTILADAGLSEDFADALEDAGRDVALQAETDAARERTGTDVGTPIIHFEPPEGVAFFGPVISRLPADEDAAALWDHVVGLARFPGFAEIKRSLRELPQLPALGVSVDEAGVQQDWHGGSRRRTEDRG